MRRLCYSVAASLDGFIAGPNGEFDWIPDDPSMDLAALYRHFDTLLIGRKTYDLMLSAGQTPKSMSMKAMVVSTTLDPAQHPDVTIVSSGVPEAVAALKAESGKDIWLFGGGVLFRTLVDARLVDTVEVAVCPILLGSGIPLIPAGSRCALRLEESSAYPSGILRIRYVVA
jgi:dihydrofolate reductase